MLLKDNPNSSKNFYFFKGDKNLVGSEVKIYSLDPSTQWFSATVINGNPASKTLQVNCEEVKMMTMACNMTEEDNYKKLYIKGAKHFYYVKILE